MCKLCEKYRRRSEKIEGVKSVSFNFMLQKLNLETQDDKFDEILKAIIKNCKK